MNELAIVRQLRKVFRDVFGGGSDISAANPLEVHDPKVGSLISYEGTTTANGGGGGITLICSDLTTKPDFDGNLVIITSGAYEGQARDINGVTTGGTVTPSRPFGGVIVSGTKFVIVGITTTPAEVAAIEAKLDHASHGLAALKLLIDALEGKLDVLDPLIDDILVDTGTTLPATLTAIAGYIDTEVAAILADTNELQTDWHDGGRLDLLIDLIKTQTDKIAGKLLFSMDFWSAPQEEVLLSDIAAPGTDVQLPSVTVAGLPNGATIVRAVAMFKFRMVENTAAGVNKLQGGQHIQVEDDGPGTLRDAISLLDDMFTLAATPCREGGDVLIGDHDISVEVDGLDTYLFFWTASLVDAANLQFNDVQTGLRIWYSV